MLKNSMSNTDKFIVSVAFVCLLSILFLFVSLFATIYSTKIYKFDFCIQSQCIDYFANKITGVVVLAQFFGWFITLVAALGGAIIALRTYVTGVGNSNITNHIAHFSMFRDFVNSEINKRKKISPDSVDVHLWYNVIFPESKSGRLECSQNYRDHLNNIKEVIDEANSHMSTLSGKYKYQTHQRKIIEAFANFGVVMNNGPKNIFIDIEYEVFGLIDSVNSTFVNESPVFCKMERRYS